jgi:hypothetical protein
VPRRIVQIGDGSPVCRLVSDLHKARKDSPPISLPTNTNYPIHGQSDL